MKHMNYPVMSFISYNTLKDYSNFHAYIKKKVYVRGPTSLSSRALASIRYLNINLKVPLKNLYLYTFKVKPAITWYG